MDRRPGETARRVVAALRQLPRRQRGQPAGLRTGVVVEERHGIGVRSGHEAVVAVDRGQVGNEPLPHLVTHLVAGARSRGVTGVEQVVMDVTEQDPHQRPFDEPRERDRLQRRPRDQR